jgi:hypothetical protein
MGTKDSWRKSDMRSKPLKFKPSVRMYPSLQWVKLWPALVRGQCGLSMRTDTPSNGKGCVVCLDAWLFTCKISSVLHKPDSKKGKEKAHFSSENSIEMILVEIQRPTVKDLVRTHPFIHYTELKIHLSLISSP